MAAMQLVMDQYIYSEETAHEDWPTWVMRFENFLFLSNIDLALAAGQATAKRHMLHSGGHKVAEIIRLEDPNLNYDAVKALMNANFAPQFSKLALFTFRNSTQQSAQSFDDYILKLRRQAIAANIPLAQREAEILHVIAQNTNNSEVRTKALAQDSTLLQVTTWMKAQDAINKCEKIIESSKPNNTVNTLLQSTPVNAVRQPPPPRECFNCGNPYPHALGAACPAEGKECHRCHKTGHFQRVCFKEETRRPYNTQGLRRQWQNNDREMENQIQAHRINDNNRSVYSRLTPRREHPYLQQQQYTPQQRTRREFNQNSENSRLRYRHDLRQVEVEGDNIWPDIDDQSTSEESEQEQLSSTSAREKRTVTFDDNQSGAKRRRSGQ